MASRAAADAKAQANKAELAAKAEANAAAADAVPPPVSPFTHGATWSGAVEVSIFLMRRQPKSARAQAATGTGVSDALSGAKMARLA